MLNMLMLKFKLLKDDKIIIIVMTIMALVLTFVFSSSMGGTYKPRITIIDNDNTLLSRSLIDEMESSNLFSINIESEDKAKKLIEEGNVIAGVLIKNGFNDSIKEKKDINISILRTKESMELFQLENKLRGILYKLGSNYSIAKSTANFIAGNDVTINKDEVINNTYKLSSNYWKYKNPIRIESEKLNATKEWAYDSNIHNLIGFTLFFSTFTIVFVSGDILKEKQQNTWQRKLISPVSKFKVISSHIIASCITGFIQTLIIVLVGNYLLGINWGSNIIVVLILFAAFVFTITCLGLFIAAICKTYEQLGSITPIILISLAMLGGCMWPLEIISSKTLIFLSNLTPHKWALEAIERTAAYGLNVSEVMTATGVLLLMGIIYLIAGLKLVKKY